MNAEFNWWLLIVGLVVGAGLVWLVVADSRRRDADVTDRERAGEARWIGAALGEAGRTVEDEDVLAVLRLHEAYLAAAPPDTITLDDDVEPSSIDWADVPTADHATAGHDRAPMAHPMDAPSRSDGDSSGAAVGPDRPSVSSG